MKENALAILMVLIRGLTEPCYDQCKVSYMNDEVVEDGVVILPTFKDSHF